MNPPERWEKIKDVFESALARTGGERRAFLEGACAGDQEMLREVESLLSSFDSSYLEGAAVEEVAGDFVPKNSIELEPGSVIGQYKVVAELGKGGQGAVFQAVDTKLNRMVAIKMLPAELTIDDTARKRFHREAQLASSLDHPNICAIHDLVEANGTHLIVMQFVDGKNVRDLVAGRPLDLASALRIGIQVCDALAAAHDRGVIHRDIKAQNVMVSANGTVKILDFGLAKLTVGGDGHATELTALGTAYGTPTYAAPEQSRGETVDHRADIFSTGVLMYEMLTGTWAFHGKTAVDVRHAVMHDDPKPIADRRGQAIPPRLDAIVERSLEKEPERRFQSIAEMRDELLAVLRELPESSANDNERFIISMRRFSPSPKSASRKLVAASAAAALLILAAGFFAYRSMKNTSSGPVTRKLTRLTFDAGLQSRPSWSPDGKTIAYYSDKNGNFDIWTQAASGGEPVQVTDSPANDLQPDFSPDGRSIVFRSERDGGGLFVMPTQGGTERKISPNGHDPRWSPDGSRILFCNSDMNGAVTPPKVYTVGIDGKDRREVWPEASNEFVSYMRAAWHPDGKRVSFIGQLRGGGVGLWTVPVDGGQAKRSEVSAEVDREIKGSGLTIYDLAWAPSGALLFLEGDANGVRNLWKVAVEPDTLRWSGTLERLTTGAGKETGIAVSPDGTKIAFTTQAERTRVWSFPLNNGKLASEGQPITSAGVDTGEFSLSPDGSALVFVAKRAGKLELWEKTLGDGKERLLATAAENDVITSPRWSPDARIIAYALNHNPDPSQLKFTQSFEKSIVLLPVAGGGEKELTSPNVLQGWPWDWTNDGRAILGSSALATADPEHWGLYLFPIDAAPHAEASAKLVFDDERYNIWQGKFSPDMRWILFLAAGVVDETDSFVGVVPADGGSVVQLIRGGDNDKARWAPDGKSLFFYSNRSGFRNIWSLAFDSAAGRAVGEPVRITDFQTPDRILIGSPLIGHGSMITDLAPSHDKVLANVTQVTGSVWILDNVDR